MGFYGNVFYELQNAFSKLIIKHNHNTDASTAMTVKGIEGQITLQPNNEWITLTADADNILCGISHKEGAAAGTIVGFDRVDPANAPGNVTTLDLGQVFKTSTVQYDKAGHVVDVTNQYLKLPISDTEAEVGALNEDVSLLKANDANKETRLSTIEETIGSYNDTITGFEGRIVGMETQLTEQLDPMVANYNEMRPWIGNKSDIAENPDNLDDPTTITGVIGNVFDVANAIGVKAENRNIAGCLDELNKNLETTDTQVKANLTAIKEAFDRLIAELNNQLAKEDIKIDVDLWTP